MFLCVCFIPISIPLLILKFLLESSADFGVGNQRSEGLGAKDVCFS